MQVTPQAVTTTVAPVKETPAVAPAVPEVKDPTKNPEEDARFAQLARREKQLRAQAKQFQDQKAAFEAEKAQLLQKAQTPDTSWKDKIKQDLIGTLAEAGLTYDEVLNTYVNHTPMDQNMKLFQAKMREIEEKTDKLNNQFTETQKQNYNQAVKQIKTEVKQLVKSAPEDFEVINSQGELAEEAVVKLIEKTYEDEGYLMDVADAAREVEDYMAEQTLALAKLKKIQAKLTPSQEAAQAEVKIEPKEQKTPTTLSHDMQSASKPLTAKERRQRAIMAFEGKLS